MYCSKNFTIYLLLIAFGIILVSCAQQTASDRNPVAVIEADDISVEVYHFEGFKNFLEQKDDYTYVINFWATWCKPCIVELPHFEKLREEYQDKKVKILLVSLDFRKQAEEKLIPFIKKKNIKSEVILLDDPDFNSWINRVDPSWTGAIPATVIYNKNKRKFYEQPFEYEGLEEALLSVLK